MIGSSLTSASSALPKGCRHLHLNWHFARYREFWAGRNFHFLIAWVDREFDSRYGEDDLAHSFASSTPGRVSLTRPNLWATPPNKVIDHPHLVQSSILTHQAFLPLKSQFQTSTPIFDHRSNQQSLPNNLPIQSPINADN